MELGRFIQVLQENRELFARVLVEEYVATYIDRIVGRYKHLKEEGFGKDRIYSIYLDFAHVIHAIYDDLLACKVSIEDTMDLLCQFCMHTTELLLEKLSFIQLAYYYSVNKPFLKLILTQGLTSLESLGLTQALEELSLDEELSMSMVECHIDEYLAHYDVEILMDIIYVMEHAVDIFLEKYMAKATKQKKVLKIIQ